MTKHTEVMKLALEALEAVRYHGWGESQKGYDARLAAITALREALAEQPAPATELRKQEPVAWCSQCGHKCPQPAPIQQEPIGWWDDKLGFFAEKHFDQLQPIYKSPPTLSLAQRQARSADTWVGLTFEEVREIFQKMFDVRADWPDFADAIEAKLKEKNT